MNEMRRCRACRQICGVPALDCDNTMANGCEQVWDNNNCGACGAKCPSGTLCFSGCCTTQYLSPDGKYLYNECQTDSLGGKTRQPWGVAL